MHTCPVKCINIFHFIFGYSVPSANFELLSATDNTFSYKMKRNEIIFVAFWLYHIFTFIFIQIQSIQIINPPQKKNNNNNNNNKCK